MSNMKRKAKAGTIPVTFPVYTDLSAAYADMARKSLADLEKGVLSPSPHDIYHAVSATDEHAVLATFIGGPWDERDVMVDSRWRYYRVYAPYDERGFSASPSCYHDYSLDEQTGDWLWQGAS